MKLDMKELLWFLLFYVLVRMIDTAGLPKYVIILGISVLFLFYGKGSLNRRNASVMIPGLTYVFFGLISCAVGGHIDFYTVKQGILVCVSSIAVYFLYEKILDHTIDNSKLLLWAFAAYNLLFFSLSPLSFIHESSRAFLYGVFALYFFVRQDWKYMGLSVLLCYASNKRMALLAMVCALCYFIFIDYVTKYNGFRRKNIYALTVAAVLLSAYLLTYMIHTGFLVELFDMIGMSSMGRDNFWSKFREFADFDIDYMGHGLGFVISRMEYLGVDSFRLLHSDFYTVYLDAGFIGFGAWILSYFWAYYSLTRRSDDKAKLFAIGVIIYTFLLYLTDNVLVYIEYWFPVNLMLLEISNPQTCEEEKIHRLRSCAAL